MKIGVDLDDVVADYMGDFTKWLSEHTDTKITKEDITQHDLGKALGVTEAEAIGYVEGFEMENGLSGLRAINGSQYSIQQLQQEGHEVYFLTSRAAKNTESTYKWLKGKSLPIERTLFTKGKGEFADWLGLDIMIDDNPKVILDIISRYKPAIVFDKPWNHDLEEPNSPPMGQIYRAKNWREVMKHLEQVKQDNYA